MDAGNKNWGDIITNAYSTLDEGIKSGKQLEVKHLEAFRTLFRHLNALTSETGRGKIETLLYNAEQIILRKPKENAGANAQSMREEAEHVIRMNLFPKEPKKIDQQPGSHIDILNNTLPMITPKGKINFIDAYNNTLFIKARQQHLGTKFYIIVPSPTKAGEYFIVADMVGNLSIQQDPTTNEILYRSKNYSTVDELMRSLKPEHLPLDDRLDKQVFDSIVQRHIVR